MLKSVSTGHRCRVARLRILRFSPRESSVYFRFLLPARRGLFQRGVGQWWRIIGTFTALAIVFFEFSFCSCFFSTKQTNMRFFYSRIDDLDGYYKNDGTHKMVRALVYNNVRSHKHPPWTI
ncbi:conserved protein of unknown function [Xenorhabdus poinarii G6]|uniref:Uncharacterized protein n=1 Tax=Xenorhabdus poinarii G6 TaxID=1354304 RepID=A0A068QYG3_9GAMM|nr:conserved protein of unknown function [Xenorhabdus poinarii G6]